MSPLQHPRTNDSEVKKYVWPSWRIFVLEPTVLGGGPGSSGDGTTPEN